MKRARRNEQDMIGLHRSVLGRDGGAYDVRQQDALHAYERDFVARAALAAGDLVDLVEKDDAVLLDRLDRFQHQLLAVEKLVGFLVDQDVVGFRYRDAPRLGAAAAHLAEDIADGDRAYVRAGDAGNFKQRHAPARGLHLDFDFLVVELAGAQALAEGILGRRARVLADQGADHALLGGELGAGAHVLAALFPRLGDRHFHQIAHDLLDVPADIADLGELGRLDLDEGRAGKPGEPAGNLGLADSGGTDHQDVLGQHLLAQLLIELQAPPAIAQRDRDRALGVILTDDVAVELGDDFTRGKVGHEGLNWPSRRASAIAAQLAML